MNLTTTYLGIRLPHPLIVGAGPLTDDVDTAKELEDEGAAALVLRSLFEEEITGEQRTMCVDDEDFLGFGVHFVCRVYVSVCF